MSYTHDLSAVPSRELAPGVLLKTMWGDKIMLSLVEIAANAEVPEHSHPHEQAGMVLEGEFDFTIGGETTRVKKGDTYIIPGGVPHSLVANDAPSVALDIFSPPARGLQAIGWEALPGKKGAPSGAPLSA